jgi:Transglutaminase-like superfamily
MAAALFALSALPGSVLAQSEPLFVVPIEGPTFSGSGPLRLALYSRETAELARLLGVSTPDPNTDRLDLFLDAYPVLSPDVKRSWLEPTFVIDYREPEVMRAYEELVTAKGQHPSREELVDFVSGFVSGVQHGEFEFASEVARDRKGDCTEFAVLTAALARAAGAPARVAIGVVLISGESGNGAFGHAWAEILEGDRWVVADAALHKAPGAIRYVPFGVLTNEGPGYMLDLGRLLQIWVQRVVVLGADAAASR